MSFTLWEFSSAGRASALQAECRRFDPVNSHSHCGAVVQMVRMPACHAGGRGFDSHLRRSLVLYAGVAQLAEQLICNQQVAGSSPITGFVGV